jgi:NAD(P)-dependent dehydrogenase (short-subunit alcohol dehydrogenase family)
MIDLSNKTIFITGASSGIGRQCAIAASSIGANLILIGRDQKRLEETYSCLTPGNHIYHVLDITNYDMIEKVVSDSVSKIGVISGFLSCAGIESTVPLKILSSKLLQNTFSINVFASFEIAKVISKNKYLSSNGASFVFISSIMALLGQKGKISYCSSKAALLGGIKAMALELAEKKIRANCILPAMVETEMTKNMFDTLPENSKDEIIKRHPLGIGKPEDISNLAMFLLSDLSKWITGSDIVIDGGYSCQ